MKFSLKTVVAVSLLLLTLNAAYIWALPSATITYMGNVLAHLVIGIIYSFQIFTQALVVGGTTGKPAEATLMYVVVLYRAAFRYFNVGYAAAMATVLFVGVLLLTLLIFRTARSWVHYEGEIR